MVGEIDEAATDATKASTRCTMYAKQWIKHPDYDSTTFGKDIGLVYLPVDVYQSKNVDIAPLYLHDSQISTQYTSYYKDQLANVAGWGQKGSSGANSNTLQYTTIKFVALSICLSSYASPDPTSVCYGTGSTTQTQLPCYGDEGRYQIKL
jgi:hypothetical protein